MVLLPIDYELQTFPATSEQAFIWNASECTSNSKEFLKKAAQITDFNYSIHQGTMCSEEAVNRLW